MTVSARSVVLEMPEKRSDVDQKSAGFETVSDGFNVPYDIRSLGNHVVSCCQGGRLNVLKWRGRSASWLSCSNSPYPGRTPLPQHRTHPCDRHYRTTSGSPKHSCPSPQVAQGHPGLFLQWHSRVSGVKKNCATVSHCL